MNTRQYGALYEKHVAENLAAAGWLIVARNVRYRTGEVDIVGVERGQLVFLEVKAWRAMPIEALQDSIDTRKQRRIISTARIFIQRNPRFETLSVRFDVVFVKPESGGIHHIRNAFVWDD